MSRYWFVAVAGIVLSGCQESSPPAAQPQTIKPPPPLSQSAPKGPHGGVMVPLHPDKLPAEYLYDAKAGKVRVYLDGPAAETATAVVMYAKVGELEVKEFPFQKGDEGWESEDDSLLELLKKGESGKVTLSVKFPDDKALTTWRYLSLP